jgi:serine/threonine-protein kinase RsbW
MAELPNVRLNLSSRPENVLLVRQALAGIAETIALDSLELNDISTAVSEACNNVSLHAYEGAEGPLELDVHIRPSAFDVVVRDHGVGIHPRIEETSNGGSGGIGLPIMLALAQSVEFRDLDGVGTEVRLEFATSAYAADFEHGPRDQPVLQPGGQARGDDLTSITLAPALAPAVLPRLLGALAARASFSTSRISDVHTLADSLAAHTAEILSAGHLGVGIGVAPRELELRIGPLQNERADALVRDPTIGSLGSVLSRLANAHELSADTLTLRLADDARI